MQLQATQTAGQTAAQEEAEALSTDRPLPVVSQQPARPSTQTAPSQVGPGLCGSCSPSQHPPPSSSSSWVLVGKGEVAWDWSLGRQRVFRQAGLTPSQEGPSRLTGAFNADSQSNLLRLVQGHLSKVTVRVWWAEAKQGPCPDSVSLC